MLDWLLFHLYQAPTDYIWFPQCPDNDGHNVDAIDALTNVAVVTVHSMVSETFEW